MKTYTFDVKLWASVHVKADSETAARTLIGEALDCAECNFGSWPDGSPILAEASIEGEPDIYEE